MAKLARTSATVLVATHSPIILDSPSEFATRVLVLPGENGTELRPLAGSLADGRIATLSDATSIALATSGRPRSRGDRAVSRLLREARAAGIRVKPVGLDLADILHYLDDEVCRQAAPRFPGWEAATAESGNRNDWKRWVTSRYGLSLTRDSIRNLAAECRRRGKIPAEIARAIEELLAYAAEPGP